jgi:hypothetical protein
MRKIVFTVPLNGAEIPDPSMEQLREWVFHGGEKFWAAGSGQGLLEHVTDGPRKRWPNLLLMFEESEGFYLEYIDGQGQYHVPIASEDYGRKVLVYIGGDPIQVPPAFFLSADIAWSVVEEFCRSGEGSSTIRWKRRKEVDWNYSTEEG